MDIRITELPAAGSITGDELVPVVQNGQTVKTTVNNIVAQPSQTQEFLTVTAEPTLPNSRYIQAGTGLAGSDGGSQQPFTLSVDGLLLDFIQTPAGMVAKTDASSVAARQIQTSGAGLQVTNGDGVAGNPTISFAGLASQLATLVGQGIIAVDGTSANLITVQGTVGEISVADGDGGGTGPVVGIADNPVLPGNQSTTVPVGTTGQRGTGSNGQFRFNTDTNQFEGYRNGWSKFGAGDGTVTSVSLSGGTTGLTVSGNPITSAGTLMLQGYPVLAGNLAGGTSFQLPYQVSADTTAFVPAPTLANTYFTWTGSEFDWVPVSGAGTVTSVNVSGGLTGLSFTGGPVVTSGTISMAGVLNVANGGTGATTQAGARTNLGLGSVATQNANNISITGGSITGITDLAVADGGTGASDAAGARANLGLGSVATQNANNISITGGSITGITDLAVADGGTGASDAAGARANLGLGSVATQNANDVAITGGSITGITDLAVADGGTGASDAAGARANLSAAILGANDDITSMTALSGGISTPDFVAFDTTPETVPTTAGALYWDAADGNQTLSVVMAGANVIQQIGQETYYRIKATSPISEGQVVMFTGTLGASGALTGAPATGLTAFQSEYVMGVATENIALNGWGYVTWFGLVRGINATGGAEAWVDGTVLYYDPAVPGGLTKNIPTAPNPKVIVASVVHAASNGSIFVRPTFGSAFGSTDSNVQFGTLNNGDVIVYDSTAQYWKNVAQSTLAVGSAVSVGHLVTFNNTGGAAAGSTFNGSLALTVDYSTVGAPKADGTGASGTWNISVTGNAGNVSGVVAIANGGTGQTTQQAAINALAGALTSGYYLRGNGSNVTMSAIQAADVPTLNQNTTGNAATATSLAGGTAGQVPYQTAAGTTSFITNGTAGQVLTSTGTGAPAWSGISGGTF